MRKLLQNRVNLLAILLLFIVCACGEVVQEMKAGRSDTECKLLIAVIKGRASEFKNTIIHELVERYKDTCAIEVINVSKVEQIAQKEYDVVVLVDACRAGMRFNTAVKNIIEKLDKEKLVLFITAGDSDWEYTYKGVDAVTSASQKEKEQEVVQEIAERIDTLLS